MDGGTCGSPSSTQPGALAGGRGARSALGAGSSAAREQFVWGFDRCLAGKSSPRQTLPRSHETTASVETRHSAMDRFAKRARPSDWMHRNKFKSSSGAICAFHLGKCRAAFPSLARKIALLDRHTARHSRLASVSLNCREGVGELESTGKLGRNLKQVLVTYSEHGMDERETAF
ncbi:uncharacterized protein BKA78DRAFT_154758 [Phyllosticta capitalensis]|uniref:uncharacterized protein n=1 Tax=Phyllosticta capitalensis TaxID=121624 RepID=UPI0031310F88